MAGEVFETEAWFANLLAHGFERPLHSHGRWSLGGATPDQVVYFPLMQQQPGAPLQALSNFYSCLYGPVGSVQGLRDLSAARWYDAVQALRRWPGAGVLRLQPLASDSLWLARLQQGLRDAGYWTDQFFCFGNWYQPVPEAGFAAYWDQRPSMLRSSVERGRRRLDRTGAWRIEWSRSRWYVGPASGGGEKIVRDATWNLVSGVSPHRNIASVGASSRLVTMVAP